MNINRLPDSTMTEIAQSYNWDEYFLNLANVVQSKSRHPRGKIGCVIVGPDNEIRSTGYNELPRKVRHLVSRYERPNGSYYCEHSERNAIYNAARVGIPLLGCRIYVPWHPCSECTRGIIGSGIIEVITDPRYPEPEWFNEGRWKESQIASATMLSEAGVKVRMGNV